MAAGSEFAAILRDAPRRRVYARLRGAMGALLRMRAGGGWKSCLPAFPSLWSSPLFLPGTRVRTFRRGSEAGGTAPARDQEGGLSMIPKSVQRFSEKIMLHQ